MIKAEKFKSDAQFIKEAPLKQAAGSHHVNLVWKQKKSGRTSVYVRKLLRSDDRLETAFIEAIAGDCYRYMNQNLTPKVRVVTHDDKVVAVISKQIVGFQEASDLSPKALTAILQNTTQIRQLASLLVSSYCFAEDDLHDGNWGLDAEHNIVKIDNDRSFMPLSCQYIGFAPNDYSQSVDILSRWPNSVRSPKERWSDVTMQDIENLPNLFDGKGTNWPRRLNRLSYDSQFQYWKYYYLTRFILMPQSSLKAMIAAHCPDKALAEQVCQFIMHRQKQLTSTLLNMKSYRQYLIQHEAAVSHHLNQENTLFNESFIRRKQLHRIVPQAEQQERLDAIYQRCLAIEETPEKARYKELLVRHADAQKREEHCKASYQRLNNILQQHPNAWDIKLQLKQIDTIATENQITLKKLQDALESITRSRAKQDNPGRALLTQMYAADEKPSDVLNKLRDKAVLLQTLQSPSRLKETIHKASGYYRLTNKAHDSFSLFELAIHYRVYRLAKHLVIHLQNVNAETLLGVISQHLTPLETYCHQKSQPNVLTLLVEAYGLYIRKAYGPYGQDQAYQDLVIACKDLLISGKVEEASALIDKYRQDKAPSLVLVQS